MIAFITAGLVLGLSAGFSPGPLLTLVISQAARYGMKEGIKVALAPLITDFPIVVVSVIVLARFAQSPIILGIVSIIGGCFVFYIAYDTACAGTKEIKATDMPPQSIIRGAIVNFLSPHPYLFWLAVGAPTTVKAWAASPLAAAGFIGGFYLCLVGAKIAVALLTGKTRRFINGKAYRYLMYILGIMLFFFSFLLVRDGLVLLGILTKSCCQ